MAIPAENGSTANTVSAEGQLAPANLEEKPDDMEIDHTDEKPEYATGLRLTIIMCTIFSSTLLAALDIVRKINSDIGLLLADRFMFTGDRCHSYSCHY